MKKQKIKFDKGNVNSFITKHKTIIATLGGITVGLAVASLMGNEKTRKALGGIATSLVDVSGKFVNEMGGYKNLLAPLFSKTDVQGV